MPADEHISPDHILEALWDRDMSPVDIQARAEAGLDRVRETGDKTLEAAALLAFAAYAFYAEGNYESTRDIAAAARLSALAANNRSLGGLAMCYVGIARECLLTADAGVDEVAAVDGIYRDALDKLDTGCHPRPYAACLQLMARFALNRGDPNSANEYCGLAESIIESHGPSALAALRFLQADIASAQGNDATARGLLSSLSEAAGVARDAGALATKVEALLRIGELSERLNEIGAARKAYQTARDVAAGTDQTDWAAEAARRLGLLGPK